MQILLGLNETIVKINSHSQRIDYIQHFINTHFLNRSIQNNIIYIPKSKDDSSSRAFLLKWLYTLYVKKTKNNLPQLKELLVTRQHKAIKIILQEKVIHRIVYSVLDKQRVKVEILPLNNQLTRSIQTYLQVKMQYFKTHMIIYIHEEKEKILLKKLLCTKSLINIPHEHIYSKKAIENFLKEKEEETKTQERHISLHRNSLEDAHFILGSFPQDNVKILKKRYKKLAKVFHPDKIHNQDESSRLLYTKKFQNISNAYNLLLKNAV